MIDEENNNGKWQMEDEIVDVSSFRSYCTYIPTIVRSLPIGIDGYGLYYYYKSVAGDGGSCFQKTSTILKFLGISKSKFIGIKKKLAEPMAELGGKSLITITPRYKKGTNERDTDLITINDIWDENFEKILMLKKTKIGGVNNTPPPITQEKNEGGGGVNITRGGVIITRQEETILKKEEEKKKEQKEKKSRPAVAQPSPEATALSLFLFEKLKKINPEQKQPNLVTWAKEIDDIMRKDRRTPEGLREVVEWAFSHKETFWNTLFQSPKTLRKHYDRARLTIENLKKNPDKASIEAEKTKTIESNRSWASQFKNLNYDENRRLKFQDNCVWMKIGAAQEPVGYGEPNFRNIILNKLKNWGFNVDDKHK